MEDVIREIDSAFDAGVESLLSFLSIPSVSGDPAMAGEVGRAARWLADYIAAAGLQAKVEATGGHPVVTANARGPEGAPTLLVYGHYDVQPAVVGDGWTFEPFSPRLADGAIKGRGASDDKGQLFCHVLAAAAFMRARGSVPVNLKMIFEGEEEVGSMNLEPFIAARREELAADAVVVSDTSRAADGRPALTVGLRGLLCLEVRVGGANRDLHSGSFGGAVANPANGLAKIIAGLTDPEGRVTAEGFYDRVRAPSDKERASWALLKHDEEALARSLGVDALGGEKGFTALERMWARPTFDVNGITAGYQGEGPKTVIPREAGAKLSFRLVPDQYPEEAARSVEEKIRSLCPPGLKISVSIQHKASPVLTGDRGTASAAAVRALRETWGMEPAMIREGGSIPVVESLARLLGAPVVLMGLGRPDDGAHGPDERFHLEDLRRGTEAAARFFENMGKT